MVYRSRKRRAQLLPVHSVLSGVPDLLPAHPQRVRMEPRHDVRRILTETAGVRSAGSIHWIPGRPMGSKEDHPYGRGARRCGYDHDGLHQLALDVLRRLPARLPGHQRLIARRVLVRGRSQLVRQAERPGARHRDDGPGCGRPVRGRRGSPERVAGLATGAHPPGHWHACGRHTAGHGRTPAAGALRPAAGRRHGAKDARPSGHFLPGGPAGRLRWHDRAAKPWPPASSGCSWCSSPPCSWA